MIRIINTWFIVAFGCLMAGCSTYIENEASLAFEPIYPAAHVTPDGEAPTGGIFKTNGNGLFASDIRARDVGDILTVALNETFAATKAQTAASAKNDTFGVTLPTGLPNILTGGYDKNAAGLKCRYGSILRRIWNCRSVELADRPSNRHRDPCLRQWQHGDCWAEKADTEQR